MDGLRKWQLILNFFTYPPGDRSIKSQAQTNIQKRIKESEDSIDNQPNLNPPCIEGQYESLSRLLPFKLPFSAYFRPSKPKSDVDLEGLIQSGSFILKVIGLRKDSRHPPLSTINLRFIGNATLANIMAAIEDAGES